MNKTLICALIMGAATTGAVNARGLSPATGALLARGARTCAPAMQSTDTAARQVRVFLTYNSAAALDSVEAYGGSVCVSAVPGLATVSLPISELTRFAAMPQIDYIEVGSEVNLLNNNLRSLAHVDEIHSGTGLQQPYTGKGIVIGIIDNGLEYNHVALREADGVTSRLVRVWNQNGNGKSPAGYDYGAEYTTPAEIAGASYDSRDTYHATHVTGIAAGSPQFGCKYYGMATEAEIVFVSFSPTNSVGIADAISYIFDYADEVDKPCVINMSLGAHQGPHDGTSALDRTIDALTGPGRIIVGAAGNEGEAAMHVSKTFTESDNVMKTMLAYSSASAMSLTGIDIWGEAGSQLKVKVGIANPLKGNIVAESKEFTVDGGNDYALFFYDETGAEASFMIYPALTPEGRPNIYIEASVEDLAANKKPCIIVEGEAGSTVHMWNIGAESFTSANRPGWSDGETACSVGEIGGTANSIISVGSFNSCNTVYPYFDPGHGYSFEQVYLNRLSSFSSKGPTADGRMKPEVSAGGMLVVSAVSQYASTEFDPNNCIDRVYDTNHKAYYYGMDAGTSMSSPAVAGIVALWLEAQPDLTPDQIKTVIANTAAADRYCGTVPNNQTGHGKINALAGLKWILEGNLAGLDQAQIATADSRVWCNSGVISAVCAAAGELTISAINGSTCFTAPIAAGYSETTATSLARGIYIVTLPDGTSHKLAI